MTQTEQTFIPGQIVGQYRVVCRAGSGGMGEVYLAEDMRLERKVALKVVMPCSEETATARESLLEEARALAALSHPNIVNLFDVLEFGGKCVLVMEWVDGEPLANSIGRATNQLLKEIAQGIGSALAAAHKAGIIHGDIKPSNIMLASDGRVRVLDFGICRRATSGAKVSSSYSGTTPYMAPELFRGGEPSPQTDLFALGVLLYEVAVGHKPFTGDYEAAIEYAIVHTTPPSIATLRADVDSQLTSVVERLLAKDPSARYQSAEDVLRDLTQPPHVSESVSGSRVWFWSVVAAVIVIAAVAVGVLLRGTKLPVSSTGRVIAVLPFKNLADSTGMQFSDAMTDAVISGLARDTQLSVLSRSAVMPYKSSESTPRDIAAELSASYVLSGSIEPRGGESRVRVKATLYSAQNDRQVWADQFDGSQQDLLELQRKVVERAYRALTVKGSAVPPAELLTEDPEAYNFYLRGNDYFNRSWSPDDIQFAIEMYERAIATDSEFAAAWAMLARGHASMFWEYYDRSPERKARARQAVERALALDSNLAEAHLAQGYYYYHCELNFGKALEQFYKALALSPKNPEVLNAVGAVERRQANFRMAAEHFVTALQLDPRSYLKAFDVGLTYGLMREYDSANQYLDRAITLGPDWDLPYIYMAWLAILRSGDVTRASNILAMAPRGANLHRNQYYWWLQRIVRPDLKAILSEVTSMDEMAAYYLYKSEVSRLLGNRTLEHIYADSTRRYIEPILDTASNPARYYSYLGLAYAGLGQKGRALQYGQKAVDLLPTSRDAFDGLFLLVNMAEILVTVGEYDQAVGLLQNMLTSEWGLVSVPYLQVDPLWKPLHDNPAFRKLTGSA